MKNILKQYYVFQVLGYFFCSLFIYIILYYLGIITNIPDNINLLSWDANFYHSILKNGYLFIENKQCNSGFLPLFSYLWKITSLNVISVSILNGLIYLISTCFLAKTIKPKNIILGLFMSLPFMMFMYCPLSESFFFALMVGLIYCIKKEKYTPIYLILFLASMTRPVFVFIIPAFIGMHLMKYKIRETLSKQKIMIEWIPFILPIVLGIITISIIQYIQVSEPFAYYKIQSTAWGHEFGLPVFPMGINSTPLVTYLYQFNFALAVLIAFLGLNYLMKWLKNDFILNHLNTLELFSVIYLTMCLLNVLLFNPEWFWISEGIKGTYLIGVNRYIHATPFILIFLNFIFNKKSTPKHVIFIVIMAYLLWTLVSPGYYKHIKTILKVSVLSFFVLIYMIFHYTRWKPLGYLLVLQGFVLQCLMYDTFMDGDIQLD